MKVCLDTNLYIRAQRDRHFNRTLQRYFREHAPFVHVHRTVMTELAVGARSMQVRNLILSRYQEAAASVGRLITPGPEDWDEVSRIVVELRVGGHLTDIAQSFMNDCLIAASCARLDVELITSNLRDFERISLALPRLQTRKASI